VLSRGEEAIAIEVKASKRWRPEYLTGLRASADLPGLRRRLVVYLVDEELRPEPGVEVLPLARLLAEAERGPG